MMLGNASAEFVAQPIDIGTFNVSSVSRASGTGPWQEPHRDCRASSARQLDEISASQFNDRR
jgi:hypothetical protein